MGDGDLLLVGKSGAGNLSDSDFLNLETEVFRPPQSHLSDSD